MLHKNGVDMKSVHPLYELTPQKKQHFSSTASNRSELAPPSDQFKIKSGDKTILKSDEEHELTLSSLPAPGPL